MDRDEVGASHDLIQRSESHAQAGSSAWIHVRIEGQGLGHTKSIEQRDRGARNTPKTNGTKCAVAQLHTDIAGRQVPLATAYQQILHAIAMTQRDHPTYGGF